MYKTKPFTAKRVNSIRNHLFSVVQCTKRLACVSVVAAVIVGCGGGTSGNTSAATTGVASSGPSLAAGYKLAKWQSGVDVTFKDECTMVYSSTGAPSHGQAAYYLTPDGAPVVAQTPRAKLALGVSVLPVSTKRTSYTINVCPQKQASSSKTQGGAIGWTISGAALFNAYEADNSTVAMADNVSYSFGDSSGKAQVAAFLDPCNGHQTPKMGGSQYHYHSYSPCLSSAAGDTGGASHLVGVANDGFPIYSDRDIHGALLAVGQLDECGGIDSATPEFPAGVYHYVLPSGAAVQTAQAAPNCLRGKVSAGLALALAQNGAFCVAPAIRLALLPTTLTRSRARL